MTTAAEHWADALRQWGIPEHILEQAPQSPWIHPVENFRVSGDLAVDTPSRHRALEALTGAAPSVLDVGCGGGRAAFGLVPPATSVVGVDHQQVMLDLFADEAAARGVTCRTVLGDWPDVADQTPACDVVTCHHVFFNVQRLTEFAAALTSHAHHRVVVELPHRHPLSHLSDAWRHFWGLERPASPTAHDALEVLRDMGLDAHVEAFTTSTTTSNRVEVTDLDVEHMRIRLCLPADRDPDVREFLQQRVPQPRELVTLWWDTHR
ncbi:MAG: class I SAM-dependent methyltransferase [Ilumatobacteraceae bacterium]